MARRLNPLGRALQQYVVFGDFDATLWPFIPKSQLIFFFNLILAGANVFYHLFFAEPIDITQVFTTTKRPIPPITPPITPPPVPTATALVALRLRETGYRPAFAPGQTWNWDTIVWAFPNADVPYSVTIEEASGIVPIPGADFDAFQQTVFDDPLLPNRETSQGYFINVAV